MKVKTIVGTATLVDSFDSEVNKRLQEGWNLQNVHTDRTSDEVLLIAHLERFDRDD